MASSSTMCASCLRAAQRAFRPTQWLTKPSGFARRTHSATNAVQPLYLDFLAPPARLLPKRPTAVNGLVSRSIANPPSCPRRALAAATSATAPSPSDSQPAHAILHPRTSPSGEPMRISLSPRAAHRLSAISATDSNPNLALRITVESGGCHGFQYLMSLTDLSTSPATEEDTVFEGDKGAKVVIDEASLELLNGSTVDYTMELIGSQFKVTGIPGATSSCGCGTSFDIKL